MVKATMTSIPLIQETNGVYAVIEEGRSFLERLSEDCPLAVVVVAGRYRTGKSFLLNRGLLDATNKKGFSTGNSINACTRGVWIYPAPLTTRENRCFIVLDTEGTASMEAKAEQDARLIGIALSLASVFVFNATGSLDETSLSDLATLTTVAQGISSDKWQPPELIWVLRDFALQLQGDAGEDITAEEYLERALSEERYGKGGVRSTLKHFFRKRTLFPMVRPCIEESQLQKLNSLTASAFRPEFQKQLEGFRELVKTAAMRPKELGGIALNGPALARLALAAVASVNEGNAPAIQTTFDFLQERRAKEFEEETHSELGRQVSQAMEALPTRDPPKLELPEKPSFMQHLPELWQACEQRLAVKRAALERDLEEANLEAQHRLLRDALAKAEVGDVGFSDCMRALEERIGPAEMMQAVPRLHCAYVGASETRLKTAEARLAETASCVDRLQAELQASKKAHSDLREEMDEALVHSSSLNASAIPHEEYAQMLADTRLEAQTELRALSERRDALTQDMRNLQADAESAKAEQEARFARCAEEARCLREALATAEARRDELASEAAANACGAERAKRNDLEEIKADFQIIVRQCEERASTACQERDLAQLRSERAEQLLLEGQRRVAEELTMLEEAKEASRKEGRASQETDAGLAGEKADDDRRVHGHRPGGAALARGRSQRGPQTDDDGGGEGEPEETSGLSRERQLRAVQDASSLRRRSLQARLGGGDRGGILQDAGDAEMPDAAPRSGAARGPRGRGAARSRADAESGDAGASVASPRNRALLKRVDHALLAARQSGGGHVRSLLPPRHLFQIQHDRIGHRCVRKEAIASRLSQRREKSPVLRGRVRTGRVARVGDLALLRRASPCPGRQGPGGKDRRRARERRARHDRRTARQTRRSSHSPARNHRVNPKRAWLLLHRRRSERSRSCRSLLVTAKRLVAACGRCFFLRASILSRATATA
jgi:Guanylate-binding protein, N-terminal domain